MIRKRPFFWKFSLIFYLFCLVFVNIIFLGRYVCLWIIVQIFQSHNIRNYFLVNVHKCWCFLILWRFNILFTLLSSAGVWPGSPAILFQFNYTSRGCLTVRWSRFVSAKVTRVTELCAPWLSPSSMLALECPCGDARGSGDHVLVLKAVSGLCLHRIC